MNPSGRNSYDPIVRSLAADLRGYLRLPGGTMPSGFTYGLFDLWPKADEENWTLIATAWQHVAFVPRAHDSDGEAGLRRFWSQRGHVGRCR